MLVAKRPCRDGAKKKVEEGIQEETENPDWMVQIVLEETNTWDGLLFSGSPYVRFTSRCCHYTQICLHTEQQVLFSMAP